MVSIGIGDHLSEGGLAAVTWVGVGIVACLLAARTYLRITRLNGLRADDYLMFAAFIMLIAHAAIQTIQTPYSYAVTRLAAGLVPITEQVKKNTEFYTKMEFTIIGLFWTTLWLVKASFLALYYRFFVALPCYRRTWWFVVVFAALSYIVCWIGSVHVCHPVSNYFIFGACVKEEDKKVAAATIIFSTVVDVLTDLMIMALPLNLLHELRISRPEKQGLAIVFSIGLIIVAVAITRAVQVTFNTYHDAVILALWGVIETTVAVGVGCLPPFKCLFPTPRSQMNPSSFGSGAQAAFSQELRDCSIATKSQITNVTTLRSSQDFKRDGTTGSTEHILGRNVEHKGPSIVVHKKVDIISSGAQPNHSGDSMV